MPWFDWVTNWRRVKRLNDFYCYLARKAVISCYIFLLRMLEILSIRRVLWEVRERRV